GMFFFSKEEGGIRYGSVPGVQTCALPIFAFLHGQRAPRNEVVLHIHHHEQVTVASLGHALGVRDPGPRHQPARHQSCRSCEELAPIEVSHAPPPWCREYSRATTWESRTSTSPSRASGIGASS